MLTWPLDSQAYGKPLLFFPGGVTTTYHFTAIQFRGIQGLAYGWNWLPGIWHVIFLQLAFWCAKNKGMTERREVLNIYLASWLTWICSSAWFLRSNSLSTLEKISDYLWEKERPARCPWQHTKSPQMVVQVQSHAPVALLETWALFPVLPTNLLLYFTFLLPHCPRFSWNLEYSQPRASEHQNRAMTVVEIRTSPSGC